MLGRHLVDVLLQAGVSVRALVRSSSDTRTLQSKGAALIEGDAGDRAALRRAVEGMDRVFHVAGYLTAGSPFGDNNEAADGERSLYKAVNVDFTEALLQASLDAGVGRFVFVSSSAVYSLDAPVPTAGRRAAAAVQHIWPLQTDGGRKGARLSKQGIGHDYHSPAHYLWSRRPLFHTFGSCAWPGCPCCL